jgi:ATP-dependent protease ClpP protease subunit
MAKEIKIYNALFDYTINEYMSQLGEVEDGEDFTFRMCCPGGDVLATWGLLRDVSDKRKAGSKATLKIDGMSASMGTVFAPFFDYVECLDVSRFMLHSAAGYTGDEENEKMVKDVRADLLEKMKSRIDSAKLKEIKGRSLKQIMMSEDSEMYWLSAKEAKAIGLVDKVVALNPAQRVAAEMTSPYIIFDEMKPNQSADNNTDKSIINTKPNIMTLDELKTQSPEAYAQAMKQGQEAEANRVKAWMAWHSVDAELVTTAIKDGKVLDAVMISELSAKAATATRVENHKEDNADSIDTPEAKTEEEKKHQEVSAFWKKVEEASK